MAGGGQWEALIDEVRHLPGAFAELRQAALAIDAPGGIEFRTVGYTPETRENGWDSASAGAAPAPSPAPDDVAAMDVADPQPGAMAEHSSAFAPQAAASASCDSADEQQVDEAAVDTAAAPAVAVQPAPGMTAADAEDPAPEDAGLQLLNPPRRPLQLLYPSWAKPSPWSAREEPEARTGVMWQVSLEWCPRSITWTLHDSARSSSSCRKLAAVAAGTNVRR